MEDTLVNQRFAIKDCYNFNERLRNAITTKVNEINKEVHVAQLDDFENHFIVRAAHPGVHTLYK